MSPKYYKILDCTNQDEINREILTFIETRNLDRSDLFWNPVNTVDFVKENPLLVNYLRLHQLNLRAVSVTVGKIKNCCDLHVDTPPAKFKLNWPVKNTKNTYTRWFLPITDHISKEINSWGGTNFDDYSQFKEVERVELLQPCLIDATVPHDVFVSDSAIFPRIGLQCMFFKEPTSLHS